MKASFGDQQLRLRLAHEELLRVLDGETVSIEIAAPGLAWAASLSAVEGGGPFAFDVRAGKLECRLPRAELTAFAAKRPGRDSLHYEVACGATEPLSISIDVDIRSGPSRRPEP